MRLVTLKRNQSLTLTRPDGTVETITISDQRGTRTTLAIDAPDDVKIDWSREPKIDSDHNKDL